MPKSLKVTATVEGKYEQFPRFVCIPLASVSPWKLEGTTTIECTINGVEIGRRSLKRWDIANVGGSIFLNHSAKRQPSKPAIASSLICE
jgi:hypothetical protein